MPGYLNNVIGALSTDALYPPLLPLITQHLAKEIVQSRKAVSRLYVNKAHMQSLNTALTEQLGEWVPLAVGPRGAGPGSQWVTVWLCFAWPQAGND